MPLITPLNSKSNVYKLLRKIIVCSILAAYIYSCALGTDTMKKQSESFNTKFNGMDVTLQMQDLKNIVNTLNTLITNRHTALVNTIPNNFLDSIPKANVEYQLQDDTVNFGLWILESDGESLELTHRGMPGGNFSYRFVAPVTQLNNDNIESWAVKSITFEKISR